MTILKTFCLGSLCLLMSGCMLFYKGPTTTPPSDPAAAKLAETADAINQSLNELKGMEKASMPPINQKYLPYPTSSDMVNPISIDWSGPIEPLLQRIAWMNGYKLRVIGAHPAIPVLVTISAKNTPVGYVIRDANFQAGSRASVQVYPGIQVIELRYGHA